MKVTMIGIGYVGELPRRSGETVAYDAGAFLKPRRRVADRPDVVRSFGLDTTPIGRH
jgi:hypothetical protein